MKESAGKSALNRRIVVGFGAKGGSGVTALLVNLGHCLTLMNRSVVLLDADLQLGDTACALGIKQESFTWVQAVRKLTAGEKFSMAQLSTHSSGLRVLAQSGVVAGLELLTPSTTTQLLAFLKTQTDHLLVDGMRDFSENNLAILDVADYVIINLIQEVAAIRRAEMIVKILEKIGVGAEKLMVVLNQYQESHAISKAVVDKLFKPIVVMVVTAQVLFVGNALNRGVPLMLIEPANPASKDIYRIAQTLLGIANETPNFNKTLPQLSIWQKIKFWV